MMLVDTSVWIDHLRRPQSDLSALLDQGQVLVHPFVLGELSLGFLKDRHSFLETLSRLETAPKAEDEEVLDLVERFDLPRRGLGWVDVHLLASALLARAGLLTRDQALKSAWIKVSSARRR